MRTLILFLLMLSVCVFSQASEDVHKSAPAGSSGGIMNPDISVIVDSQLLYTDDKSNEDRDKLRINEAELTFQCYLYPGVRGDFIVAMHEHDGEWNTHPEEAYVSFLDVPGGLQIIAGRKLLDFGRLNSVHPHHWSFAGTPLPLANFFGNHTWYDDGVQITSLVQNPWDVYLKIGVGGWNGRELAHHHDEESAEDEHHHHDDGAEEHHSHDPLHWHGHVYTGRISLDVMHGDNADSMFGYSLARDERGETSLHGVDFAYTYRWPFTYRKFRWQSELFMAEVDEGDKSPCGYYSLLQLTLDKNWELGMRYDHSEFADNDEEDEWAVSTFLSYYFTHSMYVRPEYRYREMHNGESENALYLQLVWGLGPHSHRIED